MRSDHQARYYPLLDLYRYLAALTVALAHFYLQTQYEIAIEFVAIIGVELFFVLSGFVLAPQLQIIAKSRQLSNYFIFLKRRWLRTIPSYLIALSAVLFLSDNIPGSLIIKFITYTQNFLRDSQENNVYSIAWSLSIEEWFYIIFPSLVLIGLKFGINGRNVLIMVSLMIITVCFFIRFFLHDDPLLWGQDFRRTVIFRLDCIAFGIILFFLKSKSVIHSVTGFLVSLIPFIWIVQNLDSFQNSTLLQNLFFIICPICFSFLILLLIQLEVNLFFARTLSHLASASYPIYLFHLFFIPLFSTEQFYAMPTIYFVAGITIFGIIFHQGFEKYVLMLRPKYKYSY